MVKAEIKTPNKRKSIANDTPAKKVKVENGKAFTPKKQAGPPQKFTKNKPIKSENDTDVKDIKPFAGTKQLKQKPDKKPQNDKPGNKSVEGKKKKRTQFGKLLTQVKEKQGTKDAELLKTLQEKITAIKERGELTKTGKKKLARLLKMKTICEEGAEAAAAKSRAKVAADKAAAGKNKINKVAAKPGQAAQQQQKKKQPAVAKPVQQKKQATKKQPVKTEEDDDDEDSNAEEEESDEEGGEEVNSDDEAEGEEDSDEEVEGEDDDEEGDDDSEEEEEDDDDSEEEAPAPKDAKKSTQDIQQKSNSGKEGSKNPSLQDLKNKDLVKKGQKRFVLFIGNIAYDTTKQELADHFKKAGDIVHIRIPTDQKTNRPRGFAYLELKDEVSYEKCLSMHHSQFKSRRINVLYTQGGKKKGDQQKKDIKAKNMKLHAMRRQGKLAGSVKESHKRSFRRNKEKVSKRGEQQE